MKKKINLGDKVRDKITKLEGIAVAKIEFLNGCLQYAIQPEGLNKDGEVKEQSFVDSQQIEIIKPEKKKKEKPTITRSGGGFRQYP